MPSVELICVGQILPLNLVVTAFCVDSETPLRSHRPRPIWKSRFEKLDGFMYHLGGPDYLNPNSEPTFFTASDLLLFEKPSRCSHFKFRPEYASDVRSLMERLLEASPEGRIIFTTDYQLGPKRPRAYKRPYTLDRFWDTHDRWKLRLNAWYEIVQAEAAD